MQQQQQSAQMWVLPDYARPLTRAKLINSIDFVSIISDKLTKGMPMRHVELLQGVANSASPHEFQREITPCKFFFDYDHYDVSGPAKSEEELKELITEIIAPHVETGIADKLEIHCAERHGQTVDKGKKTSFHFFVSGLTTDMFSIKNALDIFYLKHPEHKGVFDMSVYSTSRRYCATFCEKSKDDKRVLIPTDWHLITDDTKLEPAYLLRYMVQHVEKDWPVISIAAPTTQPDEDAEYDDGSATVSKSTKRRRLITQHGSFQVLKDVLHNNGFYNPRQTSVPLTDEGTTYIDFDCDSRSDCPICHASHEHNMWYISVNTENGVGVANHSDKCEKKSLFDPYLFLHDGAKLALGHYDTHFDMARSFCEYVDKTYVYNAATGSFHRFNGSKWERVDDLKLHNILTTYLMTQIYDPMIKSVEIEWKSAAQKLRLRGEAMDKITDMVKHIQATRNRTGNKDFINGVFTFLRSKMYAEPDIFDARDDVIHFNNGKYVLSTGQFLDTEAADYNTMTTGFDFVTDTDPEHDKLYEEVITSIFPDPAVREAAQRCFAASLTGHCNFKRFFVHTDKGGDMQGNNGKTLIFDLHAATLGDYAAKPRKEIYYSATMTNSEQATPGFMMLMNKRVALTEELDSHKKFNLGDVKEWTNGTNTAINVRQLHKSFVTMLLKAKFHVGVNNGKFPHFDTADTAFRDRLLIVPYMSQFTDNQSRVDPVRHIYKRNYDMSRAVKDCRLSHMHWLLQGYQALLQRGIGDATLPPYMISFKENFVYKQSPIFEILDDILVHVGSDNKIVDMEEAWAWYKDDKRFSRSTNKDEFATVFKVFAKSKSPSAWQCNVPGRSRGSYAVGFKRRDTPQNRFTMEFN